MDIKIFDELSKKYQKAMEDKAILKGMVRLVKFEETVNDDALILDLDGVKGVVAKVDVDSKLKLKSLVNFVGREVSFVVTKIDREHQQILCSRALAQNVTDENIMARLNDGEAFQAQIINILKYGAYVEIDGVTGLLKNVDFAEDYTTIEEMMSVGDKITVKLKKFSENGRLIFEAVNKYKNPTIMDLDMFEKNQVVLGVVRSIKPWGVFVQIAPNLDALCSMPSTGEIEEDMKVSFKITKVIKEQKKVRGKILKVL